MASCFRKGLLKPLTGARISVMSLGRYRDDEPLLLEPRRSHPGDVLRLTFRAACGSKGLQTKDTLVLDVTEETKGFQGR